MVFEFKRYECKFMVTSEQASELRSRTAPRMRWDSYCKDGKPYKIYNIYYDTPNRDVLRRSVAGPYFKEKLRLRRYDGSCCFLEIKRKVGKIVLKRRVALDDKLKTEFLNTGKLPETQIGRELSYYIRTTGVEPYIYLAYDRIAYSGIEDPTLRITFDTNIRERHNNLDIDIDTGNTPVIPEGYELLEIKTSSSIPLWLTRELSSLKIYRRSFSKAGTVFIKEKQA